MTVSSYTKASHQDADDEMERAFPGREITHVLQLVSTSDVSAMLATLLSLERPAGCVLQAFHMTRRCNSYEHKLVLSGIRTAQVRLLYHYIGALDGVARVTLEHQLQRP